MMAPGSLFSEGGPWTFAVAGLALAGSFFVFAAFVLALFARIKGRWVGFARAFAVLTVFCCFIPTCAGLAGRWHANRQAPPEGATLEQLQAIQATAAIPLKFGACTSVCCFLPALIALLVLPRRKQAWEEALEG